MSFVLAVANGVSGVLASDRRVMRRNGDGYAHHADDGRKLSRCGGCYCAGVGDLSTISPVLEGAYSTPEELRRAFERAAAEFPPTLPNTVAGLFERDVSVSAFRATDGTVGAVNPGHRIFACFPPDASEAIQIEVMRWTTTEILNESLLLRILARLREASIHVGPTLDLAVMERGREPWTGSIGL